MKTEAIVMASPTEVEPREVELPAPGPGELLVQARYTCVSPGTELRCWAGRQPEPIPHPFIPGYAMSGTVVGTGPGTDLREGTAVICKGTLHADVNVQWGGHTRYAVTDEANVIPLPPAVDPLTAAAVKLAAIAYHGVRVSRPQSFERVLVAGLGPIGHMAALAHGATGAEVVAADLAPQRTALVRERGIEALTIEGSLGQALAGDEGFDVVVDATGHPAAIDGLIAAGREVPWDNSLTPTPRYVIQGSYADRFSLPPLAAFAKEMSFLMPRDHQRRDIEAVLSLIGRGRLDLSALLTDLRPPEEAQAVYDELREAPSERLTSIFTWDR